MNRGAETIPSIIAASGDEATQRFTEFFAAALLNANTRTAYHRAVCHFFGWLARHEISALAEIKPAHVVSYFEVLHESTAIATVKQNHAAIRKFFDWLVDGQIVAANPAVAVRCPKHVEKTGKTQVLSIDQARAVIAGIDVSTVIGLRDRALIGVMIYACARIGAVVAMQREDYYPSGDQWRLCLREKRGKRHDIPAHHKLAKYLGEYIAAANIGDDKGEPLFRTARARTGKLTLKAMHRVDVYRMIRRRALKSGFKLKIGCHTFRATGLAAYFDAGGSLDYAQHIAAHASPQTTRRYYRRDNKIVTEDIDRIDI
jgi:site-specific recombinase XerD